jgi:hypothetical protein
MATNEQTQKDTAKAKSRTFGRSKKTSKDTAKAKSRTFGRSKRAKEEEEEELLVQEEILRNNPMMQPTDLMGQQAPQEDVNPFALAGLGGAAFLGQNLPAGGVNPQVTGPVSQGLFQSSNIIGRNLPTGGANPQVTGPVSQGYLRPAPNQPVLMGQPQSYQGVPTGPNTPPQFTGNAPARPIPGTQLAPPNQPPAVSSAGGAPANTTRPMKAAQRVGPPATIAGGAAATGLLARLNPYVAAATGGYLGGKAIDAFGGDALRAVGLTDREGNISDMLGSSIGETMYGDGNLPAFSEEELLAMQGEPEANLPQMSRLGDEPLVFNAPTGPSSTATQAAQIAATLPDDSGLMGAPGVQETGIPTATLNVDGGSATVPQGLADLTFQTLNPMKEAEAGSPQAIFERIRAKGALSPELIAAGQARAEAMGTTFDPEAGFSRDAYLAGQADPGPMGRDATMDRLGGRTLNEYLNAPDGTEGVSGLRTDPQGRMIPGGFDTRADAYGQYEDEVSQAYQRQSERMQQRADQRDGTAGPRTYGGYTTSQLRGMVGGGDNLRAAQMRAEAGLNPVTGNREKTEAERAQSSEQGQLQNQALQARIDVLKQGNPDKVKEAEDAAARMGLEGRAATIFTLGKMGINTETIFEIIEASKQGGGGGAVPDSIAGLAAQYSGKTLTGPDGTKYKSDGTSWTAVQ